MIDLNTMKNLLLIIFTLSVSVGMAQDKWRALNLTNINGTNISGTHFTTISANLHWDFNKRYFITNWTGFQLQYGKTKTAWFTNQAVVNRYVGNWMIGVGAQYGLASDPGVFYIKNKNAFAITTVSYRWKFK